MNVDSPCASSHAMVSATTLGRPPLSLHASCTLTPNTGIVRLGLEVPPKRSF